MSIDELPPITRGTGPDTSRAAEPSRESRQSVMGRLYAALEQRPMTTEEAAVVAGLDHWQATKRMSDLRNAHRIEDSGERRRGTSGRQQTVWRVKESGR